jgi:hypothetical protein
VRKISPPPRFDLQAVQPVASSYFDCAVTAHATLLLSSRRQSFVVGGSDAGSIWTLEHCWKESRQGKLEVAWGQPCHSVTCPQVTRGLLLDRTGVLAVRRRRLASRAATRSILILVLATQKVWFKCEALAWSRVLTSDMLTDYLLSFTQAFQADSGTRVKSGHDRFLRHPL